MCGICGVASNWLTLNDKRIFMELMHVNVLRGWEGAGVLAVPEKTKKEVEILRTTDHGTSLVMSDEFKKLMDSDRFQVLLGHCRAPTKGGNVIENVHPHEVGNIIGVHNGTFRKIDGKWFSDAESSDTRAFYDCIVKDGVKEAIKKVDGAYALVWFDKENNTMNFLRNAERPLYYMAGMGGIFWSSEYQHLYGILSRHNRVPATTAPYKIEMVPPHKWMSFDVPVCHPYELREGDEVKPERENYYTRSDPFLDGFEESGNLPAKRGNGRNGSRGNNNGSHLGGNYNHANAARHNGSGSNIRPINNSVAKHFLPPRPSVPLISAGDERGDHTYQTFPGTYVTREKLLAYLKHGCVYCSTAGEIDEYLRHECSFVNWNEWICDKCMNNPAALADCSALYPHLKEKAS